MSTFGNNNESLGAASGSLSVIRDLGTRVQRFGPLPSKEDEGRQQDVRDKLLARLALPDFRAKTERDLEDWADAAARQVSKYHVCVRIFQESWEAVSQPSVAAIVGQSTTVESHEALVNDVALRVFPRSQYVSEVEEMLFHGKRQSSVLEAQHWMIEVSARYMRLCARRVNDPSIANTRALRAAQHTLPAAVEDEVLRLGGVLGVDEMFTLAYRVEEEILRRHGILPEPMGQVLAIESTGATNSGLIVGSRKPVLRAPGKCQGCGS